MYPTIHNHQRMGKVIVSICVTAAPEGKDAKQSRSLPVTKESFQKVPTDSLVTPARKSLLWVEIQSDIAKYTYFFNRTMEISRSIIWWVWIQYKQSIKSFADNTALWFLWWGFFCNLHLNLLQSEDFNIYLGDNIFSYGTREKILKYLSSNCLPT